MGRTECERVPGNHRGARVMYLSRQLPMALLSRLYGNHYGSVLWGPISMCHGNSQGAAEHTLKSLINAARRENKRSIPESELGEFDEWSGPDMNEKYKQKDYLQSSPGWLSPAPR